MQACFPLINVIGLGKVGVHSFQGIGKFFNYRVVETIALSALTL
jgi:hypothetical protein